MVTKYINKNLGKKRKIINITFLPIYFKITLTTPLRRHLIRAFSKRKVQRLTSIFSLSQKSLIHLEHMYTNQTI
jgi:hypothetical protein